MLVYALKRLLWMLPVMLGVLIIVFTITYFTPGDPIAAMLGPGYTPERYAQKAAELGLDQGYFIRLGKYIWNAFVRFDLGRSYLSNLSISDEIAARFPITLCIGVLTIFVMAVVGMPLGIFSAIRQYGAADAALTVAALVMNAIPAFVFALLSLILFGVVLRWLPVNGLGSWKAWILPVVTSALPGIAVVMRMSRTTMLEVIRQDYIRTARSKGLKEGVIIRKHALKNCLIPLITVTGGFMTSVLAGSIIVETIFGIPGLGMYLMGGIIGRDYPVINGSVLLISLIVCILNLVVDLLYAMIDPRIKAQYSAKKGKIKKSGGTLPPVNEGGAA
ncbi:MAG: ABC transporter permease [Oscillospiraceae bacterium]|jgi:peptide/nickel transport system permease protein|nr:ABC transporter permease [Oscillospiraceae bacterium]